MNYLPFDPAALPMLVIYPTIALLTGYLFSKVVIRYIQRHSKVARYLMLGLLCYFLTCIILTVGIVSAWISGYFDYIYRISVPVSYATATLAAWYMFHFSVETFWHPKRWMTITLTIFTVVLVIWILFDPIIHDILGYPVQFNYWERPAPEGVINLNAITKLVLLGYNLTVYGVIYYKSRVEARRSSTEESRRKIEAIGMGSFMMICFYLMFFIDGVLWVIRNRGFSIFAHIGWFFAFAAAIEFYRGFLARKSSS